MLVLQNCVNLLEVVLYSYTETCHGRNEVINIKVEDVIDIQEEKYPVQELVPVIKAEQEACLCIHC
jgi:hypothetical protein